jgi:transcriptional regulator with XRE-family HTH domain
MKTIQEFSANHNQLIKQEELILDATELISKIMAENNISKAELARRLGKTKAYVTQCLSGEQNLTLRTLADIFTALEHRAYFGAESTNESRREVHRLYPVKAWAFERPAFDLSMIIDCAASSTSFEEISLCDAA